MRETFVKGVEMKREKPFKKGVFGKEENTKIFLALLFAYRGKSLTSRRNLNHSKPRTSRKFRVKQFKVVRKHDFFFLPPFKSLSHSLRLESLVAERDVKILILR